VIMLSMMATLPMVARAENLLTNPGFETGDMGWEIFIPENSPYQKPTFTVVETGGRTGKASAKLTSDEFARFALTRKKSLTVYPKERYRVSFWYRADAKVAVQPGTPGLLLRATLSFGDGTNIPKGHVYVGAGGRVSREPSIIISSAALLPVWTKVEAVIEIPEDAEKMGLNIFYWLMSGTVFIDDVVFEAVPANTPLTELM
jgi:hypothetical protein